MKTFEELNRDQANSTAKVQLAHRQPVEVSEAIARRARQDGVSKTAVVEAALRAYLLPAAGKGPEAGRPGDGALSSPVQAPPRLLVDVLADATRLPRALCARYVEKGQVTVGGYRVTDPKMGVAHLPGVEITLNGSAV